MTVTETDAQAALREVERTLQHSAELRGYQRAAPHLIVWGVVWAVGYAVGFFQPAWVSKVWLVLIPIGMAGSSLASARDPGGASGPAVGRLVLVYFAFVLGVMAVFQPQDPREAAAFFPLVIAAAYGIMGSFGNGRMLALAAALFSLTLFGFFTLGSWFGLWMSAVGGGGLILGGLWLRRA